MARVVAGVVMGRKKEKKRQGELLLGGQKNSMLLANSAKVV